MRDMGLGDAGTDVGMLQEAFGLPATGVYDKNTSRKIAQWQAANSLPRSGYFGAASREVFARSAQMQMRRVVVTSETYGAGGPDARALAPRGSMAPSTNVRATIGVSSSPLLSHLRREVKASRLCSDGPWASPRSPRVR